MQEIVICEEAFSSPAEVHAYLAAELAFPAYYGCNLDALSDCLSDISHTVAFTVNMADCGPEAEDFALWFPKLCRVLLRSARDNECLEVVVHAASLRPLGRLAACSGMVDLLDSDAFVTQGVVACLS